MFYNMSLARHTRGFWLFHAKTIKPHCNSSSTNTPNHNHTWFRIMNTRHVLHLIFAKSHNLHAAADRAAPARKNYDNDRRTRADSVGGPTTTLATSPHQQRAIN